MEDVGEPLIDTNFGLGRYSEQFIKMLKYLKYRGGIFCNFCFFTDTAFV